MLFEIFQWRNDWLERLYVLCVSTLRLACAMPTAPGIIGLRGGQTSLIGHYREDQSMEATGKKKSLTPFPGVSLFMSFTADFPVATRPPHFFQSNPFPFATEVALLRFEAVSVRSRLSVDCCFFLFLFALAGFTSNPAATR